MLKYQFVEILYIMVRNRVSDIVRVSVSVRLRVMVRICKVSTKCCHVVLIV